MDLYIRKIEITQILAGHHFVTERKIGSLLLGI